METQTKLLSCQPFIVARCTVDSTTTEAFYQYAIDHGAKIDDTFPGAYWFDDLALFVRDRGDRIDVTAYSHSRKKSDRIIKNSVATLDARKVNRYGSKEIV